MIPVEDALVDVVLDIRDLVKARLCVFVEVAVEVFLIPMDGGECEEGDGTVSWDVDDLDRGGLLRLAGGSGIWLGRRCHL